MIWFQTVLSSSSCAATPWHGGAEGSGSFYCSAEQRAAVDARVFSPGRGVVQNKHSTDVESPPASPPRGVIEKEHSTDVESPPPLPRGVIENEHSTDVESPPSPPRGIIENKHLIDVESPPPLCICISIHNQGKLGGLVRYRSSACSQRPSNLVTPWPTPPPASRWGGAC